MDRRGRGASGDHPTYTLEKEFDDVAALVDSIGEATYLFGHSYGGLCTLHASLRTRHVKRLLVYEPYVAELGRPRGGRPHHPPASSGLQSGSGSSRRASPTFRSRSR